MGDGRRALPTVRVSQRSLDRELRSAAATAAQHSNLEEATMARTYPYIVSVGRRYVPKDSQRAIPENVVKEGVRSRSELDLPPPVLTVQDLAVLLATSSSAVYSRVARGQIPGAFRIGRSLRFDRRVIAQWLSANKASAGGLP
jgi:excisionase family DNA binding protein